MAEELKIDFHSLDRAALDKLSANRPHQVRPPSSAAAARESIAARDL